MENKPDVVSRVVMWLADANRLMRSIESVLIDLIAATAPWLAPVIPAYMVHQSLMNVLAMPPWVAWIGAAVVEFLGLSAVSTTMTLWDYNDKRKAAQLNQTTKGKRRKPRPVKGLAPVWVAGGAGGFYLISVLVVNVILDDAGTWERIAKALLSSLSVIAALILAVRAQHARRLEAIDERKQKLSVAKAAKKSVNQSLPVVTEEETVADRGSFEKFSADQMARNGKGSMPAGEVMATYGVPQRTAYRWLEKYEKQVKTPA